MIEQPTDERREETLRDLAARFSYPASPDVSRAVALRVSRHRAAPNPWQVALIVLLIALAALLAIPQARALVGKYFRIGPIRILPLPPAGLATLTATLPPHPSTTPGLSPLPATTPTQPIPSELVGLAGPTTLSGAVEHAPFPIMLPTYPPDIGPPDYAFYQPGVPMAILAWSDPADPAELRLSLYAIDSESPWINKYDPDIIEETTVNGQYALWVQGLHLLEMDNGDLTFRRLVDGNTLVWQVGGVTYRLESGLPLEEAVKVAESLRAMEP